MRHIEHRQVVGITGQFLELSAVGHVNFSYLVLEESQLCQVSVRGHIERLQFVSIAKEYLQTGQS